MPDSSTSTDSAAGPTALTPDVEHTSAAMPATPEAAEAEAAASDDGPTESISQPAKVMRIGSMIKQLLEEVRQAPLDEAGRARLADIYESSVKQLSEVISPDLQDELQKLAAPFDDETPSEAELRVAQAQLVGWLEGLFHGIQATLFAQQMEARQQLEELRRRSLPAASEEVRPGTYL
ncbi:MAG TPA: proteasome activator [Acidimicrobiales bacterium]|nr:proteasome activator [Acidimicrobiales bacterium]